MASSQQKYSNFMLNDCFYALRILNRIHFVWLLFLFPFSRLQQADKMPMLFALKACIYNIHCTKLGISSEVWVCFLNRFVHEITGNMKKQCELFWFVEIACFNWILGENVETRKFTSNLLCIALALATENEELIYRYTRQPTLTSTIQSQSLDLFIIQNQILFA